MTITESSLKTDLNDLAHAMIRDLDIACKKTSIYGNGHPLSGKAIEKAFRSIGDVFRFKCRAAIGVQRGALFALNIGLKETVFNIDMLTLLQQLEISALEFDYSLKRHELTILIEGMAERNRPVTPDLCLNRSLMEAGVSSIEVNTANAVQRFETGRQYLGRYDSDFSVKRLVFDQFGNDLAYLAQVFAADDNELLPLGIDFSPDVVRYLLPERIATLEPVHIRETLTAAAEALFAGELEESVRQQSIRNYSDMLKLVDYHPERNQIVDSLDTNMQPVVMISGGDGLSSLRAAPVGKIDEIVEDVLDGDIERYSIADFADAFRGLVFTGHQHKTMSIEVNLMDVMAGADAARRQAALEMLVAVLDQYNPKSADTILTSRVHQMAHRITNRQETFEYSEYIWKLCEKCLDHRFYKNVLALLSAMDKRRQRENDVTIFDSVAVKVAFGRIDQQETISRLVAVFLESSREEMASIREILLTIGSETVAVALASEISHSNRAVRQQILKLVADLGRPAVSVFSGILVNEVYFDREDGRHELADSQWWVVRNSIFVLGMLGDPESISALRLRLSDTDVRVRREIVGALEKIGGEDAIDCLLYMAEDPVHEIRECAIIAIGLVGDADTSPLLIDVVRRAKTEVLKIVTALSRLGGPEARAFLCQLLEEDESLAELAGGKVTKEELRVAIIRALGRIADRDTLIRIKNFQASQSSAHKIFFKNSAVSKAIEEVLSEHNS